MLLQILLEKVDMNRMYVYLHALHFNADYMALNPWELLWNSVFIKKINLRICILAVEKAVEFVNK